jgi:tRNA pseudouridine38-40 synthase
VPAIVLIKINLAYDGTDFSGWAAQPGRRTVEETLAGSLRTALRLTEPPRLTVAGRTDAGVHARGQVVHVDLPEQPSLRRVNGLLPADVRVTAIAPAPDGFDARFSALWRRYSYRVCDDQAAADPLRRHDTLWYFRPLDLDAMNAAAVALAGEHDFAAFCKRREGATTVRTLRELTWTRDLTKTAVATVRADAFCHNMVRALMGALLAVGDGTRPPAWAAEVLVAGVRDPRVRVVAPHGLCLEEVKYPPDEQLANRALQTRRVRALAAGGRLAGDHPRAELDVDRARD